MRGLRAAACAALLAVLPAAAAPAASDAARLAVLAERSASLQLQVAQGVGGARPARALAATVRDFDQALATATRDAPAAMREHYALFALFWKQQRAWLAKPAAAGRGAADRHEELAWLAERGMRLAGEPAGAGADAWHAAILSQRVMREALATRASQGRAAADAQQELRERLRALRRDAAGDESVRAEVDVAQGQLEFLARALEGGSAQRDVAARSADHVLEALERAIRRLEVSASPG